MRYRRSVRPRRAAGALLAFATIGALVGAMGLPAQAVINPSSTAQQIADAINSTGTTATGTFTAKPPSGTPDAVSDSSLAAFPTDGSNYGILTTGDANLADDANSSGSSGANDNGPSVRGNTDFDVSVLKVDLTVPSGFTCLRIDFRFLSEEFPEYVGSQFNDAFIAELDTSDWTTNGSAITGTRNFAFDPDGNPITINSTGYTHMTASEANGTTYDGATPILVAQTPITSGSHSVYLSIFDQGDHIYDSAAFLDNLSLGTQSGSACQKGAQPLSNLSLTVNGDDSATVPAGFGTMPKGSINYAALSAPGSAGATSLTTSPITHGPITHGPITHGPITHGPITHGPITHGPITHGAIVNADPVYRTASLSQLPLYTSVPPILIATIPIASPPPAGNGPGPWSDALAPDTSLASLPMQTITLKQVANSGPVASNISVGDLDLGSTILANLSPAALLFSNATFFQLGLTPPSGFSSGDRPADVELKGQSLASVNFNGITLADRAGALSNSLISGTSLSGIEWESTTNGWNQPVSNLSAAAQSAVLDCPVGGCGTETLGEARNAGHLKPFAALGDLLQNDPSTFSGKTFGQLLPGLFNVGGFPFEDAPFSEILGAASIDPASLVTYTAAADVPCPVPGGGPATFTATLPGHGFRYAPGTSTVSGAAPFGSSEPSTSANDLTWSFSNAETCGGQTSGTKHVTIDYKVEPGAELGTFPTSLHVTAGAMLSVLDQAPVTTTPNFESNDTPGSAKPISTDTLYTDTLKPGPDIDYFNLPVDASDVGRTVQVSLSHIPASLDYDIVLYGFASSSTLRGAPITHGPITHGPITHGPLADDAQCGPPGTVLEPQTLQDVPQVNSADLAIRSYSTNRSTANEFSCTVIQPGDVGHGITVQVSTYNAGTSNVPAILSADESDPTAPLQCLSVPETAGDPGPDLPPPSGTGSLSPDTQTLFLVNAEGIGRFYGTTAETDVLDALNGPASGTPFLDMPNVRGAVLSVDRDPHVRAALDAWYADPENPDSYCSPEAANNVVRAINNLVDSYRSGLPNLKNIVLLGSDAVLPMARIQELVNLGSESTEAPNVQFNDKDNPTSRALSLGYMLSDDPYYSFQPIPWLTTDLYPPSVAGGRVVETPSDIVNAIDQYETFGGVLDPKTEFTTGYDFFLDSAEAKDNVLHPNYAYPKSGPTTYQSQINETWNKQDLSDALNAKPGIAVLDAHADHYRLAPAAAFNSGSVSPSDLYETSDLAASSLADGSLAFSIGCHAGLSVADVWVTGSDPTTLDWAQAFADKNSLFEGNTGYGYGDSDVIAYTEKLTVNLTNNLGPSMSVGQAIALAKQQYYAGLGSWGVFDAKSVEQFTPYGLPMYVIGQNGQVAGTSPGTGTTSPDADTGLQSQNLTFASLNSGSVDTGHGVYYKGPTGLTQAEHYRPIEPITASQDMTVPSLRLHGAAMLSFKKQDVSPFTPALSVPALAPQNDQPDPKLKDATFPSGFVSTLSQDTIFGLRDSLVVFGGQFVSNPSGPLNSGTQSLFSDAHVRAYYSSPDDPFSAGIISSVDATDNGNTASFKVTTPSSGIAAVYITFRRVGSDTFNSQKMTFNSGTAAWELTLDTTAAAGGKVGQYFAQMVTNKGDVSVTTFKALFSKPVPPPAIPGAPTVTITFNGNPIQPSQFGWYNKSKIDVDVTADNGDEIFTASVDGGPPQSMPVPVSGEGDHVVTFQGDKGSAGHVDIPIDTVKPTVTITSPADGATYNLNQAVASSYSCTDTSTTVVTSGVASCAGPVASGVNIDTASVGTKTFTVNASDRASNTNTKTATYKVQYAVCLLYEPSKPFKLSGSNVPIKLSICDNAGKNKSSASITLTAVQLKKLPSGPTMTPSNNLLTGNRNFKFDPTLKVGGGYQYNLKTSGLTAGSYQLIFTATGDPQQHQAPFAMR
jgi:hypothetical protein